MKPDPYRNVIILDLDNCLSDDGWRIKYIDWSKTGNERYAAYHERCDEDGAVLGWLMERLDKINAVSLRSLRVFIFTGRPESMRLRTAKWLSRVMPMLQIEALYMRQAHQGATSSTTLKEDWMRSALITTFHLADVLFAADDQPAILEAYARLGLVPDQLVHQFLHDLDAYRGSEPDCSGSRFRIERLPVPSDPADNLRAAADTFESRNKQYAGGYKKFGPIMKGLFPDGLVIRTEDDWNRLGPFVLLAAKLQRYAAAWETGGHKDSAHDMMPYAAMLEELTKEHKK